MLVTWEVSQSPIGWLKLLLSRNSSFMLVTMEVSQSPIAAWLTGAAVSAAAALGLGLAAVEAGGHRAEAVVDGGLERGAVGEGLGLSGLSRSLSSSLGFSLGLSLGLSRSLSEQPRLQPWP